MIKALFLLFVTVSISATVLNVSDMTDGVITGYQPIQCEEGICSF